MIKFEPRGLQQVLVMPSTALVMWCLPLSIYHNLWDIMIARFILRVRRTDYIDGLMQERRNPIANAQELRLFFTNPSICCALNLPSAILQYTKTSNNYLSQWRPWFGRHWDCKAALSRRKSLLQSDYHSWGGCPWPSANQFQHGNEGKHPQHFWQSSR